MSCLIAIIPATLLLLWLILQCNSFNKLNSDCDFEAWNEEFYQRKCEDFKKG